MMTAAVEIQMEENPDMTNIELLKARHFQMSRSYRSQEGATLVIALIILLVMSMIGVSNMQSSTMQERMAANAKQKIVAHNAAETALRVAEAWMDANVRNAPQLNQFNGNNGLYSASKINSLGISPVSGDIADITDDTDWSNSGVVLSGANAVTADLVSQQPRYVIEYLGRDMGSAQVTPIDLNEEAQNEEREDPHVFRIVAIGWAKDPNIYTVLESTVRTGEPPFFVY